MANIVQQVISRSRERRLQPYWETQNVAAATFGTRTFFQTVPTAGLGGRPGALPLIAGNMQTAGQFPNPKQFWVHGVSVFVDTVSATATTAIDAGIIASQPFTF